MNATLGSVVVDGVGTLWRTNNRGRGDRITINAVDYTILAVESETQLRLTSPFTSPTNNYSYTIARKFGTPQAWENCISGGGCPGAPSTSLVEDNRSEIGIYYYDGSNPVGSPVITFDGSITDAAHTITLTVDPGNRHSGRGAAAPTWAAFANNGANALVQIYDDYVTVEWLELKHTGAAFTSAHSIEINNVATANHVVIRYDVIHGTGNGIQVSDADTVADIYNNVIYATNFGIRIPVDLTPASRLNIFNNTIYGNTGATGPAGISTTVRQTTQRIDLRNNIVHSNNIGDIGVAPFFDRAWFFNGVYTDIRTQVADSTVNFTLNFTAVGTDCLYLGSQNPFRGVAYDVATGASGGMDLQWSYWNGAWTNLETSPFSDGTFNLQYDGYAYWSDDPAGWVTRAVSDATALYYVRACLAAGPPATKPIERQISRADISIASTANLSLDMTGLINSPRGGFVAGQNAVSLANVAFVNTGVGTENLHLSAGSFARDVANTLDYYFQTDIDATLRTAGAWDVGADEFNGTTEVRLMSLSAAAGDASVTLEWRTASELDNLGFHVYRGLAEDGPWTRVTTSLIPGLGSSATGQAYAFQDKGLANGTRYYYRLEDVDAASRTTSHGPVSAVPQAGGSSGATSGGGARRETRGKKVAAGASCPDWVLSAYASATGANGATAALVCARHGDPEAVSLAGRRARRALGDARAADGRLLFPARGLGQRARVRSRLRVPLRCAGGGAALPTSSGGRGRRPTRRARRCACHRSGGLPGPRPGRPRQGGDAGVVGRHRAGRPPRRPRAGVAGRRHRSRAAAPERLPGRDEERRGRDLTLALRRAATAAAARQAGAGAAAVLGARDGRERTGQRSAAGRRRTSPPRASCWRGSTPRVAAYTPCRSISCSPGAGAASSPRSCGSSARARRRRSTSSRPRTRSVPAASSTSTPTPKRHRPTSRPKRPSSWSSRVTD